MVFRLGSISFIHLCYTASFYSLAPQPLEFWLLLPLRFPYLKIQFVPNLDRTFCHFYCHSCYPYHLLLSLTFLRLRFLLGAGADPPGRHSGLQWLLLIIIIFKKTKGSNHLLLCVQTPQMIFLDILDL